MTASSKSTYPAPCFSSPQQCGSGMSAFDTMKSTLMSCRHLIKSQSATEGLNGIIWRTTMSLPPW